MRTLIVLLLILMAALGAPASAQETATTTTLDWIPADFAGLVRLDMTNPAETIQRLNLSYYVAAAIQPARVGAPQQRTFNDFFPLDALDTENVTFENTVLPWIGGEVVLGYRQFDDLLQVAPDDLLMVLPTEDPFAAASVLSVVVESQDFPEHETYRGASIYIGDQTSIAFTPAVVLIGAQDVLHSALDTGLGYGERLVDTPAYQAVSAAQREERTIFAYLDGDKTLEALSVALQGDTSAKPLLEALGEALGAYEVGVLETALLSGSVDGIGLNLEPDNNLQPTLRATVTLYTKEATDQPPTETEAATPDVLAMMPRSAMVVQSGADARAAFYDTLLSVPLSGFATNIVGGFLFDPSALSAPQPENLPTSDDLQAAVAGLMTALSDVRDFDLDKDLIAHLDGSYALALIPRPNNPAPLTAARYDLLLAVQTGDPEAALDGAMELVNAILAVSGGDYEETEIEESSFETIYVEPIREPLLQLGLVEDVLVVGTGSAVEQAVRADRGDNQLINTDRWQRVSQGSKPTLYVDLNAVLNTFLPAAGGPASQGIGQLGATVNSLGDGLFQIDAMVTLPAS